MYVVVQESRNNIDTVTTFGDIHIDHLHNKHMYV